MDHVAAAEGDRVAERPVPPAPQFGAALAPDAARLLQLQRAAGNRAVGRLVAQRPRAATLQRCAGPECRCGEREDEADEQRAVRRVLQRDFVEWFAAGEALDAALHMPSYRPNPAWSQAGKDNPAPTCTPFGAVEARARWATMWEVVPAAITNRCGCAAVGNAYRTYLLATGGTVESTDPASCINAQLASEDRAHVTAEADAINEALSKVPALARANLPAAGATVALPLVPSLFGGTSNRRRVRITYTQNTKAGGLLMGGDSDDEKTPDSEYGPRPALPEREPGPAPDRQRLRPGERAHRGQPRLPLRRQRRARLLPRQLAAEVRHAREPRLQLRHHVPQPPGGQRHGARRQDRGPLRPPSRPRHVHHLARPFSACELPPGAAR